MTTRRFVTIAEEEVYAKTFSSLDNNGYIDKDSAHVAFAAVIDRVSDFASREEIRAMFEKALAPDTLPARTAKQIRQVDDYETSTRVCPCGASFTWAGCDDRLDEWMKIHLAHVEGAEVPATVSADGMRACK